MKIIVLMSTYNGEKYLKQQLDSILNQNVENDVELQILVRDDGSVDKTSYILNCYEKKGKVVWYSGRNIKPAKSFWNLLFNAEEADYYAFADQDDVWFPDKISRAIRCLESHKEEKIPLLYSGNYIATDKYLKPLVEEKNDKEEAVEECVYAKALLYSQAPGCTFVFNDLARREFQKYDINVKFEVMHDWLAHKIVLIKGKMFYDYKPMMYYRQHENNVIGNQIHSYRSIIKRIKRFISGDSVGVRSNSAKALIDVYGKSMSKRKYYLTSLVADYNSSLSLKKKFISEKEFRNHNVKDVLLFILILWGKV